MIKNLLKAACVICSICLISSAYAWDGAAVGIPWQIHITDGPNFGFRIFLQGGPALCGNGVNWAYLNSADSNYNTYVASLLMAKAQGTQVQLYTNRDSNGYCHIGYSAML
jgi:hypothetical protein